MPELDAITLRALARDVSDRYQTAAQLAADLDSLLAGYRFEPKELRQFVRQLFRAEYAKELEDTQTSLAQNAVPPQLTTTARMQALPPQSVIPPRPETTAGADEPPPSSSGSKPRGFWSRLFKR
jgi:serine/threonine-protein kinase